MVGFVKMFTFEELVVKWQDLFYYQADARIRDKPLMGSPLPCLIICLSYLFVIKWLLPKWMEDRKPFYTRKALWLCNFWHLIASAYFFYRASIVAWLKYNWRCEPLDTSTSPEAMAVVELCWQFFLFKFSYMMESVIHVLGKRYELVTKYHIVHHFTLPMTVWFITNYLPGGHATFFGWINPGEFIWKFSEIKSFKLSTPSQQVFT